MPPKLLQRGSIARRLIFWIALLIGLVALAITALQLWVEYRQDVRTVEDQFQRIESSHLDGVVEQAWLADRDALKTLLEGIRRMPDIHFVEVRLDGNTFAAAGQPIAEGGLTHQWALRHEHRGQLQEIGLLTVHADMANVRERLFQRAVFIILANLAMTVVVAALMYLVVHQVVTRHLELIAGHFGRIEADTLHTPLALERPPQPERDELDRLVDEYNHMRANLLISYAELRELNATLEERVAERTDALSRANKELESFAYSVSHDLRAPLRAINGFSRILLDSERERLSADGRDLLDRVARNGQKLDQLIEDILQYSRAGQRPLERRPVDLAALAREVAAELKTQYPTTEVAIGDLPTVEGDPTMLRQVLQNLIGNGLKYSAKKPAPQVEIGCAGQNGDTACFVKDNGAGFDMRYADKLFGMFQRMHTESQFPGTGVGLAIVKRLVERHGGRVWATAEPDAGATFYFTLAKGS